MRMEQDDVMESADAVDADAGDLDDRVQVSLSRARQIHQRDVFPNERMCAFSDAVFAISSTIGIVHLQIEATDVNSADQLREALRDASGGMATYLVGFFIVSSFWRNHVQMFRSIVNIDTVLLTANAALLLLITVTPFISGLMGTYGYENDKTGRVCTGSMLVLLVAQSLVLALINIYGFSVPSLVEMNSYTPVRLTILGKRRARIVALFQSFAPAVVGIVGLIVMFSGGTMVGTLIVLYLLPLSPLVTRRIQAYYLGETPINVLKGVSRFRENFAGPRLEAFADGIFSIVATLIVLDLQVEGPRADVITQLISNWHQYLSFASSFVIVFDFWILHHSILHSIKYVTVGSMIMQILFFACLGLIPFQCNLMANFGHDSRYSNATNSTIPPDQVEEMASISVNVACIQLLVTSGLLLLVWLVAISNGRRQFRKFAIEEDQRKYILWKILTLPVLVGIVMIISLESPESAFIAYHTAMLLSPGVFICIRVWELWQNRHLLQSDVLNMHESVGGDHPPSLPSSHSIHSPLLTKHSQLQQEQHPKSISTIMNNTGSDLPYLESTQGSTTGSFVNIERVPLRSSHQDDIDDGVSSYDAL